MSLNPNFLTDLYRMNDTEIAHKYGISRRTAGRKREKAGIPNPYVSGITHRPVFDLPEFDEVDSDELWDLAEELRQKIILDEYRVEKCEVLLPDKQPILLVWLADWHIGHISTDLGRLKNDLEIIAETPGVYVAFGGDYTENTNTSRAQRGTYHEQLVPIRIQKKLAERACEIVQDKLLVMLKGNHDAWSESSDDFDFVEYLAKNFEVPYLGDYGYMNVTVDRQRYTGLMAHKGRGGGKDKTAPAKNLLDLMGDADFVFTGHNHENALAEAMVRGKPVVFASAGSYLADGRFSRGLSLPTSSPGMPGVILFNEARNVFPIRDSINNLWSLTGARNFGQ